MLNLQKIPWEYHRKLAGLKLLNDSLGTDESLVTSNLSFRKEWKEIECSEKSVCDETKKNVVNSNIECELGLKLKYNLKYMVDDNDDCQKNHNKSVKHGCDHCDYKITQKHSLLQHVHSVHEGVTCEHCDHKTKQKSILL